MNSKIRWGILGCGRIARKFASDLKYVEDAVLYAAAARSKEKADAFAAEYPCNKTYGSYEALVNDADVDAIYIATPHNLHCEHALLCIPNGKAVLCEKPFAVNVQQTKLMIAEARKQKVFLMEALWTKFLPHFIVFKQQLVEGRIGALKSLTVKFGFKPVEPVPQRLFDPALAGGTLLDIGIYNVFLALSTLGKPDVIDAVMTPASTGVDEQCAITFKYNSGALAQLFSTFASNLATEADISGTEGRIRLTHRFYSPESTIEYYPGWVNSREIIEVEKPAGWGYQFEAMHVGDCLRKGLQESPVMSLDDTLLLMETLDAIRKKAGIVYSADAG